MCNHIKAHLAQFQQHFPAISRVEPEPVRRQGTRRGTSACTSRGVPSVARVMQLRRSLEHVRSAMGHTQDGLELAHMRVRARLAWLAARQSRPAPWQ